MPNDITALTDLDFLAYTPTLEAGSHAEGAGKLCLMEAVAFVMGLPHSDLPSCTAREVAYFCQGLNDSMPPEWRQRLWDRAELVANTGDPTYTQERLDYLAIKACTVFAAMACDGVIGPALVDDLRNAETVGRAGRAASRAADAAVDAVAGAAGAADTCAAVDAARAARAAALVAARATRADARAAHSAARAAHSAASYAASATAAPDAVWQAALDVLDGLLEIGREKPRALREAAEKPTNESVTVE